MNASTLHDDRGSDRATALAQLVFPPLLLAAMLIIPTVNDPQGNAAALVTAAAGAPGRWAVGYLVYAVALGMSVLAVAGLAGALGNTGARALAGVGLWLYALGVPLCIAIGHGATGVGLAAVVETGTARAYYDELDPAYHLPAFLAAIGAGIGVLLLAVGLWRRRVLAGKARIVASVGLGLYALALAGTSGWAAAPGSFLIPVVAATGFWPAALQSLRAQRGALPSRPRTGPAPDVGAA